MFFDIESYQTAIKLLRHSGGILEVSDGEKNNIFRYVHNDQEVTIYVHHIIDNGSILFVRIYKNNYDDDILRTIPYLVHEYFSYMFSSYQCIIFYTDSIDVMKQYQEHVYNLYPMSFQVGSPVYEHSKKYMYICTSRNQQYKTTFNELIEYMDEVL